MTLIREIAERLAPEEWALVDVTLAQFGCPTSGSWDGGDRRGYVLNMAAKGHDEGLVDLAEYLGFRLDQGANKVDPPFWRKDMFRLFISHLSAHRAFAAELQEALLTYGIGSFVAHNDIEPTAEWQAQIEMALTTCDSLVALLHGTFHTSNWTDQEVGFAMGRGVPVFAVRLGQDPYGFIGRFQAFNGNGKTAEQLATELFEAYRRNKETQARIARVLISLFEQSGSFAEAKTRIRQLNSLEVWEPTFSQRIAAAAKSNGQISGAWGVPDEVGALAKKWQPK